MTVTPLDDSQDASTANRASLSTAAVTSADKILGELTDHDGTVVLGESSSTGITSSGPDETRFQMKVYAPAGRLRSPASTGGRLMVTRRRRGGV